MNPRDHREPATSRIPPGSWLTMMFAACTGVMLWDSFGLSRVSAWIPQAILSITLLLLGWQLVAEFVAARRVPGQNTAAVDRVRSTRAMAATAWISLLLLAAWGLGLALGSTLFCVAWLRWHAGERWPVSLAIAAGLGLGLWLVFPVVLDVGLYPGLLGRWLG